MTPYEYKRIDLSLIDVPAGRLRGKRPARIETLAKDIAVNGLLQPIIVVEEASGRFTLIKGLQRIEALTLNKTYEIDARVTPAAWLKPEGRRLQEIMATLNRDDLTKLERAEALADLKRVYEDLYPQTKNGGDKKSQAAKNKAENQKEIFSFRSEAAEATGLSIRAINMAVAMVAGLALATRERVRGTWIERDQSGLIALSKVSPNLQHIALDLLLSQPAEASNVADALILAEGKKLTDPTERAYRAVIDKWKRFPIGQKRSFITSHRDEILRILGEEGAL